MSTSATLRLVNGSRTTVVHPALRYFPQHDMTVAAPSVTSRVDGDLYVTLLSTQPGGTTTVRIAVEPFVGWIWAGGAVNHLAGLAALWPRRRRALPDPAPARADAREPVVVR